MCVFRQLVDQFLHLGRERDRREVQRGRLVPVGLHEGFVGQADVLDAGRGLVQADVVTEGEDCPKNCIYVNTVRLKGEEKEMI